MRHRSRPLLLPPVSPARLDSIKDVCPELLTEMPRPPHRLEDERGSGTHPVVIKWWSTANR
ncbi:hypothetical protein E2C01_018039 [Portunus trituberculatus]|uniref:Uncharacterized protein n=1 Tax=Portunus trituberculatus TaxID=210409 RepID=A0A5B7DUF9_PORTR|nr:hypothetical protein [Portunus trituberculatus]